MRGEEGEENLRDEVGLAWGHSASHVMRPAGAVRRVLWLLARVRWEVRYLVVMGVKRQDYYVNTPQNRGMVGAIQ